VILSWFRSRASGIAATLLLSLATLGVSLHVPHPADCHETDCGAILVAHDASAHRVGANTSTADTHPLHCLVCHWARSFRPHITTTFVATPAAHAGIRLHCDRITATRNMQVAQPPLRSPPASPALA
jgi:hypothetical protein